MLNESAIDSLGFSDEDGVIETVNTSVNVNPDEALAAMVTDTSDENDTAGLTELHDDSDGSDDSVTIVVADGIEDTDTYAVSLVVKVADDTALDEPTTVSDGAAVADTRADSETAEVEVKASVSLGRGDCVDEGVGTLELDSVGGEEYDAAVEADIVDVASEDKVQTGDRE